MFEFGALEGKSFQLQSALSLSRGVTVTGFTIFQWFAKLSAEEKQKAMKEVSELLKTDLETKCFK